MLKSINSTWTFTQRLTAVWLITCLRSTSMSAVRNSHSLAKTTFFRWVTWILIRILNYCKITIIAISHVTFEFSADQAIRPDYLHERFHGYGHSSTERAAMDPGWRVHRSLLHRVRYGERPNRIRRSEVKCWFCLFLKFYR